MRKLILTSLFLTAQLFSTASQSALFDDTEARKKILELEKIMQSQNQATQGTLAELKKNQLAFEQRLTSLETIAKNGLVDMQAQLEILNQENSRLKGDLELAAHQLEIAQKREKDLYADTDARLRKLESSSTPAAPSATAAEPAAAKETEEQKQLETANSLSKETRHKEAFAAYDKFLKDYPASALVPDALYGLGYSQFALKNYKSAIITQQKLLDSYGESTRVPDAMMNMANSQIQLGQVMPAKKTLRDLIKKYPDSEVTPTAQKRLKMLESIR